MNNEDYDEQSNVDGELAPGAQLMQRVVEEDNEGLRIDVFLALQTSQAYSRTYIQNLIKDGNVTINGEVCTKPSNLVSADDYIEVVIPPARESTLEPEPIPLDIVYEDDDLLVINKQRNLVVHPAPGHYSGTLVHALLYHCSNLSSINNIMRPGIVHRLDKDTTGLMVIAKNNTAHLHLSYQIRKRHMKRVYLALIHGMVEVQSGKIDARVARDPETRFKMKVVATGGKRAVTWFNLEEIVDRDHALLKCQLDTGRTHQIRVHLTYIGHPVVGDPLYAPNYPKYGLEGQALHSRYLSFEHPTTGEVMEFTAPLPDDVKGVMERIQAGEL